MSDRTPFIDTSHEAQIKYVPLVALDLTAHESVGSGCRP